MMYLAEAGRLFVFASKGRCPDQPRLVPQPGRQPEGGRRDRDRKVRPRRPGSSPGPNATGIYAKQAKPYPGFAEYEEKTDRVIPVIALDRA